MGFLNAFNSGKSITEGTQGAIPYTLPPTNLFISLLPAPQQDNKRTILRGIKKILNRKVRRDVKLYTFLPIPEYYKVYWNVIKSIGML